MISKWGGRFAILFTAGLAIVALWLAFGTYRPSSGARIAILTIVSVAGVGGGSLLLLGLYYCLTVQAPKLLRRFAVWVTFKTVRSAIGLSSLEIESTGIASIDGDLRVGLPLGHQDGLDSGDRFVVVNAANQENWGKLEVAEIDESSCACSVSDRTNPEFWDELERRMRQDASPPRGVIIRRELQENDLLDRLTRLLRAYRG